MKYDEENGIQQLLKQLEVNENKKRNAVKFINELISELTTKMDGFDQDT